MVFAYFISTWLVWILGIPFINLLLRSFGLVSREKTGRETEGIILGWGVLCLAGALVIMMSSCKQDTNTTYFEEIEAYRDELNREFSDTASTPLTEEGLANFHGLDFFPLDPEYCVEAQFVLNTEQDTFGMPTNTARRPLYVMYGKAHFRLQGQDIVLEIYRSEAAKEIEEFKEYLFLPFMDLSNGNESYGGGRYLDLKIPSGESIIIDFNKAYNPYCAYNHRYSCPIPPEVNHMDIAIPAGVMAYKDHE